MSTLSSPRVAGLRKGWVLLAVSLGQFLIQLDLTIVNVALPSIGRDLGASVAGLQWVVDGYNLAVAALLLTGGRIGDRSGHKRVYLAGLAVFAAGTGLCAVAPGSGWLVGFRVLQGVGAAIELPATLAILTHTFTGQRERAQAVGIWAGAAGSSLVIGPVLGGALVDAFGWRAVFVVNLPVCALIAVLTLWAVRDNAGQASGGLDLPGQLLGSAALGLLAGGAIEGGRLGFVSAFPLGLLAGGVLCTAAFLAVERRRPDPLLPLAFFRQAGYCAANATGLVMGFVTIGLLFVFTLFFQEVQGHSAIVAGLRFLPLTVAFIVTGPLVGRLIERIGYRAPLAAGAALQGAGALFLLRLHAGSGYAAVWWPFAIIGIGYGLMSTPMAAAVLGTVPRERAGMASSTNLTARLVGGVFGIAVLGAVLPTARVGGQAFAGQFVAGLHTALIVSAVVAAAGAVLAAAFLSDDGQARPEANGQVQRRPALDISVPGRTMRHNS
jgi:DHA2 family methylenomycin A resistance protein-like MFS transporter